MWHPSAREAHVSAWRRTRTYSGIALSCGSPYGHFWLWINTYVFLLIGIRALLGFPAGSSSRSVPAAWGVNSASG